MLEKLNLTNSAPLSLPSLLVNLGIGVVLALLVRWHYKKFSSSLSNREEFARNFPIIILTTTLIITIVKSSLALSLGLVGALSIVRFRTPIKEPEELAYLFLCISIGLGLGAAQTVPTVVAASVILTVIAGVKWSSRKSRQTSLFVSFDWPEKSDDKKPLATLSNIIEKYTSGHDLRRFDTGNGRQGAVFFVEIQSLDKISTLIDDVRSELKGTSVTVIDQNQLPSV